MGHNKKKNSKIFLKFEFLDISERVHSLYKELNLVLLYTIRQFISTKQKGKAILSKKFFLCVSFFTI